MPSLHDITLFLYIPESQVLLGEADLQASTFCLPTWLLQNWTRLISTHNRSNWSLWASCAVVVGNLRYASWELESRTARTQ